MRHRFFVITGILAAACIGVFAGGCAKSGDNKSSNGGGGAPELAVPLGMTLEDMSAANLTEVFGEGMDASAADAGEGPFLPAGSGEAGAAVALPPDAPPWWLFLYTLRQRARDEARQVIEAPAELAYYIITNPGSIACADASQSTCPLDPALAGDTCATTISFGNTCPVSFLVGATPFILDLSGSIRRSVQVTTPSSGSTVWDGAWHVAVIANAFKVTDPVSSHSMTYHGLLTRDSDGTAVAAPYKWKNIWTSNAGNNPMTLTNGVGDQLIANGTRTDQVLPGNSAEQLINTYPTIIPNGGAARHIHRNLIRTMTLHGDTVSVSEAAVITQQDLNITWIRQGSHTLYRRNQTRVVINGTSHITNPDNHTATVVLTDVVQDLKQRAPISGEAVITFDSGVVYTVTFTGVCSLSWRNSLGRGGSFNYCQWNSFAD